MSYGQVIITTACFGGETVDYIYYVIFVYRLELEDGVITCSEILIMVGTVCDCDSVCSVGPISVKKVLNLLAISILLGIGSSSSSKRIEIDFETVFTG